jgi:hypothetical protein
VTGSAWIDFAGVRTDVTSLPFTIGRTADLSIEDNPFLHRTFLTITRSGEIWMLSNVGDRLTATGSDAHGRLEAFLAPGALLPLVFEQTVVRFTAGPTNYQLVIHVPDNRHTPEGIAAEQTGETTVGRVDFTRDQRLLILALAEPALRGEGRSATELPSSPQAARRLGWTTTKFTRKLDNVCQKLAATGVRGLHGGPGELASSRRARLVEYALAVRLVSRRDLAELDALRPPWEAPS